MKLVRPAAAFNRKSGGCSKIYSTVLSATKFIFRAAGGKNIILFGIFSIFCFQPATLNLILTRTTQSGKVRASGKNFFKHFIFSFSFVSVFVKINKKCKNTGQKEKRATQGRDLKSQSLQKHSIIENKQYHDINRQKVIYHF